MITRDNFTPGSQMSPVTITPSSILKDACRKLSWISGITASGSLRLKSASR